MVATSRFARDVYALIEKIRTQNPLIHNLTNQVVTQWTANALLALGASPVMAHAPQELDEITAAANAVVINMGTLDSSWIESARLMLHAAKKYQKPVVFDPVGAGASRLRTETAREILTNYPVAVLRGNAAEILAVAGNSSVRAKGVDSAVAAESALYAALSLAKKFGSVVCISGKTDFIISPHLDERIAIHNGDPLLKKVTGMGCAATAIIAACCAVENNFFTATITGMAVTGICGELAAMRARGPGTFQAELLDALAAINPFQIQESLRAEKA